jgi:hypothetical protein
MSTMPKESSSQLVPPSNYVCPLTLEVMSDPLLSIHGHSFQREAILEWLARGNTTCPLTRKPLFINKLIANKGLQAQIKAWKIINGLEDCNMTPVCEMDVDDPFFMNKKLGLMVIKQAEKSFKRRHQQVHQPQRRPNLRIRARILNSFSRSRS